MVRVVLIKNSMRVWRNIYVRHILQGHNDVHYISTTPRIGVCDSSFNA